MSKKWLIFITVAIVLLLDQWLKIWIKTNVVYNDGFNLLGLDWARIQFIENDGMAFGWKYGGITGKYILSIFRILMSGFLGYLLFLLYKSGENKMLLFSFSLIFAGAIGNILDCIFYGLIFSESDFHNASLSQFVPFGTGYAPVLQGRVVDMLYFPLIDTVLPNWVPFWGGTRFEFFRPIFNIADSAITIGVASLLLFNRKFFTSDSKSKDKDKQTETTDEAETSSENTITESAIETTPSSTDA